MFGKALSRGPSALISHPVATLSTSASDGSKSRPSASFYLAYAANTLLLLKSLILTNYPRFLSSSFPAYSSSSRPALSSSSAHCTSSSGTAPLAVVYVASPSPSCKTLPDRVLESTSSLVFHISNNLGLVPDDTGQGGRV